MGQSGRAILQALIDGVTEPERLVALASTRLKAPRNEILQALRGHVSAHHRFLLRLHLEQIVHLETVITELDEEVGHGLDPFRAQVTVLKTIPGVSDLMAQVIVSEIGTDMSRFPTVGHLLSWAGLCPRNDESAGKRRSTRLRHGAPWLKTQLVQAAWCATRAKNTYLRAQFLRLKARRGPRKAIMAVAASILGAAYHMLRSNLVYQDLGPDYFDRLEHGKLLRRLVHKIEELGYAVTLTVEPAA
jgi:transposase